MKRVTASYRFSNGNHGIVFSSLNGDDTETPGEWFYLSGVYLEKSKPYQSFLGLDNEIKN